MRLIDSHCHIHDKEYPLDADEVIAEAQAAGVDRQIVVGNNVADSRRALDFASKRPGVWASIGLHPHDARLGPKAFNDLESLMSDEVVAIGECGLDYYYSYSPKKDQEAALRFQIELAQKHDKPLIFHVRDAFSDFFKVLDEYSDNRGVVHSFTAGLEELDQVLSRGLLIGLNGIVTFTKDERQLDAARGVPLESLLLETDAPFLTPEPNRGKVNVSKQILTIAKFLAELRGENLAELATATTQNAEQLFNLNER